MTEFTPVQSLLGGALIGLAAALLWLACGRVAGISGIVGGVLGRGIGEAWRWLFLVGLLIGASVAGRAFPDMAAPRVETPLAWLVVAGLLVGIGTRLGNGCTSGHGVCGVSRGAPRSMAATAVFFSVALLTVFLTRHWLAG